MEFDGSFFFRSDAPLETRQASANKVDDLEVDWLPEAELLIADRRARRTAPRPDDFHAGRVSLVDITKNAGHIRGALHSCVELRSSPFSTCHRPRFQWSDVIQHRTCREMYHS